MKRIWWNVPSLTSLCIAIFCLVFHDIAIGAKVYVDSEPSGARVILDNSVDLGTTPIGYEKELDLPRGKYYLEFQKNGYKTQGYPLDIKSDLDYPVSVKLEPAIIPKPANVEANKESTARSVPQPRPGKLTIRTNPSGASVELNGSFVGRTPIVSKSLEPGRYRLRISKSDYETVDNEYVEIKTGQETPFYRKLILSPPKQPLAGQQTLDKPGSTDSGTGTEQTAQVQVDGIVSQPVGEAWYEDPVYVALGTVSVAVVIVLVALVFMILRRRSEPKPSEIRGLTPPQHLGKILGDYKLLGKIGHGGMAMVYRAQHKDRPGTVVALKIPFENMMDDEGFIQRFIRQAEIGSQLSHPRIVNILDSGSVNGMPYLAMEYIPGGDLRKLMSQQKQLSISQAVNYVIQICEALDYVHLKQIYHRDIKPENILLADANQVKVVDFGIALAKGMPRLSVDGVKWFSGYYLCPDKDIGPSSDLYSLGVMFYEMLTGQIPFKSDDLRELIDMHRSAPVPPMRSWRSGIPKDLEFLVLRMMEKKPEHRYQSAVEVIQALRQYVT